MTRSKIGGEAVSLPGLLKEAPRYSGLESLAAVVVCLGVVGLLGAGWLAFDALAIMGSAEYVTHQQVAMIQLSIATLITGFSLVSFGLAAIVKILRESARLQYVAAFASAEVVDGHWTAAIHRQNP